MANPVIQIKRSTTAEASPGLADGELAYLEKVAFKKLYIGTSGSDEVIGGLHYTDILDTVTQATVLGRKTASTGEVEELSAADLNTLLGISGTNTGDQDVYKTFTVVDTDSGYTWTETGSSVANGNTDTVEFVSGASINVNVDATNDAIRITNTAPNVSTTLSTGTVDGTSYGITSDGGADDVIIAQATTSVAGVLSSAKWDEIVANSLKNTNVSTTLTAGTVTATTYGITSDGGANDIVLPEATTTVAGLLGADKWDEIVANTGKNTNVSTALSTGTVNGTSYGITSDSGTDDVVIAEANTDDAGVLSAAKWDEIVANTAKTSNVSTALSTGTVDGTSYGITSDGGADDVILAQATTTAAGLLSATKWDEIVANSLKNTNVSTTLTAGTVNATSYGITSDGGADDIILPEADTTNAGLLGSDKWDEIVANTSKVTNATHSGQADGATTLALNVTAITAQPASGAISGTDTFMTNDGGVLSEATFAQLDTYLGTSLGAGTVLSVDSGNGMNFTEITTSGTVTLGTPSALTASTTDALTANSHTHSITGFILSTYLDTDTTLAADSDVKVATQKATKAYVDLAVTSSINYRGAYNAATNTPDLDTTPGTGNYFVGDMFTVTAAGSFFGTVSLEIGDVLIAEIDDPAVAADWTVVSRELNLATTSAPGIVQLATGAEVNTGTDVNKAITPDALDDWTGSAQIVTVGTITTGTWDCGTFA
jgi:hypothetical protein